MNVVDRSRGAGEDVMVGVWSAVAAWRQTE